MYPDHEPPHADSADLNAPSADSGHQAIAPIQEALEAGDLDRVRVLMRPLHVADKADVLNQLNTEERQAVARAIAGEFEHEILPYLEPEPADDVILAIGISRSAEAISQLETDDAVHVIEELPEEEQQEILEAISEEAREELEEGLAYPEESAGRLMRKNLVSVPEFYTVGDTIDYLRQNKGELPSNFYVVYAIDPKHRPVGRVVLSKIMQTKRDVKIGEIMNTKSYSFQAEVDQEEVAHRFRKYGLVEAPVVNKAGRLIGTITVDDVVDVIQEEQEEDFMLSGGVTSQDMQSSPYETVRLRFPWLFVNLLTAVLASLFIGLFEDSIAKVVALAVLMPMVASMGGNAGIQSVTVAVRAIATRQLTSNNAGRLLWKELYVGLLNGLGMALVMGLAAWLWFHDLELAAALGLATLITLMVAGFTGAMIPLVLTRFGVDPAVASTIFLTTVTDVVGFCTFLGLGTLILL